MNPVRGDVRPPAVAGSFYSADAAELRRQLAALLAVDGEEHPRPKALILPHAGHCYCARIAAGALRHLHGHGYRRMVVVCPTHRVATSGAALCGAAAFRTPLGDVTVDQEAVDALAGGAEGFAIDDRVHAEEHAIEVLLPYLQLLYREPPQLVPIAAGMIAPEILARGLAALWADDATLVIISSDLSHFLPYETAQRVDQESCAAILAGRAIDHQRACGATGINALSLLRQGGDCAIEMTGYCNSGDSGGGRQSVVGYAGFVVA